MSGFTKLFGTLVTSTIWREDDKTRIVWITMLALADRNGYVGASIPGLAAMANVSIDECCSALGRLCDPDKYSRTPDNEGRRLETSEGGWTLLNYPKYRELGRSVDRTEYLRKKQAERRARIKADDVNMSTSVNHGQPSSTRINRSQKAEAEDKEQIGSDKKPLAPLGSIVYPPAFSVFWDNIGSTRSKGLKSEALKAWEKAGKPPADVLMAKWSEYLQSLGETFPKDVSRWIKARGWEETYVSPMAPRTPQRSDPNCKGWHAGSRNTGRKNPQGKVSGCPECKSVELREWTAEDRPCEPTPTGEIS